MKKENGKVSVWYIILKIVMIVLIVFFLTDAVMQFISYRFYKGDRKKEEVQYEPVEIQMSEDLSGYGYNLEKESDRIVLFFGGSMYIAYNTVGTYGGKFDCPFLSADYYGTQNSRGRMNLKTMQQTAEDLYDYAAARYPGKDIYIFGHSFGCGMAAYLASVRECSHLILASGYRTSADMYNRIIPIFWGPLTVFIKNNIRVDLYAENTTCPVTVIGSDADTTLDDKLQQKLADCYDHAECKIFHGISHEDYFTTEEVVEYVRNHVLAR